MPRHVVCGGAMLGWFFRHWGEHGARIRAALGRLVVVALTTGVAAALRFAMTPLIGLRSPFFTFYPAIMVSAAYGGLWSGLVCTALSTAVFLYFWIPPIGSFAAEDVGDIAATLVFVASGVAIAALHEMLHRRRAQLVAARAEAEEATRQALTADRAKDEFLSTLSHELRTPLTAILGWANVLRTRSCGAAMQARALESIERNAITQSRIVDDILDVSRIVSGKLRLELQPMELAPVITAALEVVRPAAESKGVTLAATTDPAAGVVHGDAVRLQQVAWNLLVNAVKFTRSGGRIDVRLDRDTSAVRLTVTDTGEGIAPEFLPHVFERFRQADASSTRAHGGLGLGLAIVRHLVELHGGTVAVASDGLGKGAKFTVRLPIQASSRITRPDRVLDSCAGAASLAGIRVLVVDDDLDALDLIAVVLRDHGAKVALAASAAEGLRALARHGVDVMVADVDMPEVDGYDLMRRAMAFVEQHGQQLPALALTACTGPADVEAATRAGFQVHLAKPVLPDELVRAVAQLHLAGARRAT